MSIANTIRHRKKRLKVNPMNTLERVARAICAETKDDWDEMQRSYHGREQCFMFEAQAGKAITEHLLCLIERAEEELRIHKMQGMEMDIKEFFDGNHVETLRARKKFKVELTNWLKEQK